jgi:hypothetical protein
MRMGYGGLMENTTSTPVLATVGDTIDAALAFLAKGDTEGAEAILHLVKISRNGSEALILGG